MDRPLAALREQVCSRLLKILGDSFFLNSPVGLIVLTLAEEIGLGGYHLSSRVRRAFFSLPDSIVAGLMQRVREESARRHVVYLRDGQPEVVGLFPLPLTALPDQVSYLH